MMNDDQFGCKNDLEASLKSFFKLCKGKNSSLKQKNDENLTKWTSKSDLKSRFSFFGCDFLH